jgi:hypothetical protein
MAVSALGNAIIMQPPNEDGAPVAMILINGAACDNEAYMPLVEEFQTQAAAS